MRNAHLPLLFTLILLSVLGFAGVAQSQTSATVAIIVADEFGTAAAPTTQATPAPNESCAVNFEGQAWATRGASTAPITAPHGELVIEQLEELLADFNLTATVPLVEVDIVGLTTEEVALAIEDAMTAYPAQYYVVNMSFAIVPCEFLDAIADMESELANARSARDANRHRGLFQRAVTFYGDTVYPVNSQKFQSATNLDPLQTLFETYEATVIPVAAAGNFGLNYPFWPGAWGQVISVSASTGEGFAAPSTWDRRRDTPLLTDTQGQGQGGRRVSNYGEVMLPGEFTSVEGLVSGTSFAAPRLSALIALYLSAGNTPCVASNGSPTMATGDWDNLTLAEAATACPGMAALIPPA